jgi:glycosyltransferase involved in cell wall biosynthesis
MEKNEYPKVTIVTPSYNQAEFLEKTILSVINQDYPNLEYIIMDGGSTDNSVDIIKKYEDKIDYWVSEKDNGQSDAINKGFAIAKGQIFNWLNSDDLLLPGAITIAVNYMMENPDIQMVYGDRVIIAEDGRIIRAIEQPRYLKRFRSLNTRIPQETTFFTKELWESVNGLNEELHLVMDTDLWQKFEQKTDFIHIPFLLGAYREHSASKSVVHLGVNTYDSQQASKEVRYLRDEYKFRSRSKYEKKLKFFINQMRFMFEKDTKKRRLEIERILSMIYKQ